MRSVVVWEPHYTGLDTAQLGPLYLQRDSKTRRIRFARVSFGHRLGFATLGVFLGYTNMIGGRGFEVFTSDLHFGVVSENWGVRLVWGPSKRYYTIHLWRFAFGSTTDRWLWRILDRRDLRRWEADSARLDAMRERWIKEGKIPDDSGEPCDDGDGYPRRAS